MGGSIEDAVHRILDEIQHLRTKRDAISSANPEKVSLVQFEIFRKFAIIALLISSLPLWRRWKLVRKVSVAKKEARAEAADLELMPVPELRRGRMALQEEEKDKQSDYFPQYMNLPQKVQRRILNNISSPTDKLAVVKAIPGASALMNWHITCLQIQLIFPIILDRRYIDWNGVRSLCMANSCFRDFITRDYQDNLSKNWRYHLPLPHQNQLDVLEICKDDPSWCPTFCDIQLSFDSFLDPAAQDTFQLLRQTGSKILDVEIQLAGMTALQGLRIICKCLELMPNVRRVRIYAFVGLQCPQDEEKNFDAIQLPDLPHIQTLDCVRLINPIQIERKLLEKYGNNLRTLETTTFSPIVNMVMDPSRLTRLTISGMVWPRGFLFKNSLAILEAVAGAPLKFVQLCFGCSDKYCFPSLMAALNNFGTTLKDLDIRIRWRNKRRHDKASWDPVVLASLFFPKLESIVLQNYQGEWSFLLQCPALETMLLYNNEKAPKAGRFYERVDIFDFSWKTEQVYLSAIWKLLPALQTIEYDRHGWRGRKWRSKVTRSRRTYFLQRMSIIPPTTP